MIELTPLPYGYDALEPLMCAETLHLHHDKHHATYVKKANELAAAAGLGDLQVEEMVIEAKAKGEKKLYNNAAQIWNHGFFWESMTGDYAAPQGELETAITRVFGDLVSLKTKFVDEGKNHFGSGWVWLAAAGSDLKVLSTHDADDLLTDQGLTPLLVCDLWEHAYYLDHKNDREAFLNAWFDRLANWKFAGEQLAGVQHGQPGYTYGGKVPQSA